MNKKIWTEPEIIDLSIQMTEHGDVLTKHVDEETRINGYEFYSFS